MKSIVCFIVILTMGFIPVHGENLLKSTSVSKESGWDFWVTQPAAAAGFSVSFVDGKIVAKNSSVEKPEPFNIQIKRLVDLDGDKKYKLKFKANTEKEGKALIYFGLMRKPYTAYANISVTLTPGEKFYEYDFTPKRDANGNYESPRGFNFAVGGVQNSTITISEVSLEEVH